MQAINNILSRIPIMPLGVFYLCYLLYGHYDFLNSDQSELAQKKKSLTAASQELDTAKKKLKEGEEFYKNLDVLRSRIRSLTEQLDGTKTILSADIDIANFVRMITLEAKKLGLIIKGIKPQDEVKRDYYHEVPFTVSLRGAYIQILVFFDRVAKFQQVIRVGDFQFKPSGNVFTKYVELQGDAKLVAYRYIGTNADEVANRDEMKGNENLEKALRRIMDAKKTGVQ
jgi:type IV pilus assembly protein PilO